MALVVPDIYNEETSQLEFEERTKYWGKYRAFVRDRNDREQRGRLRVYCPQVMGLEDDSDHWLGFAEACLPMGGEFGIGDFPRLPGIGAGVWIEFEQGDVEHPIWVGSWVAGSSPAGTGPDQDGESELPRPAKGVFDETARGPKGTDIAQTKIINLDDETAVNGSAHPEPLSPYGSGYPDSRIIKTASGHVIELDDSEGSERIHIYHRSGHYYEVNSDGNLVHKTVGKRHDIIQGTHVRHSAADLVVVDGPVGQTIGGLVSQVFLDDVTRMYSKIVRDFFLTDVTQKYKGDLRHEVSGSFNQRINANFAQNILGGANVLVSGVYDFTTLEKVSFTMGNTGTARTAMTMSALLGGMSFSTNEGDMEMSTLLGNLDLSTLAGDINIEAGGVSPVGNITLTSLKQILAGVEVLIGGEAAIEPVVLGTQLLTFLKALVTALAAHVHPTSSPGAPTSPSIPGTFTPPPDTMLSLTNKVT